MVLGRMPQYGVEHIAALATIVLASVGLTIWARRAIRAGYARSVDRALGLSGWFLLAVSILWLAWGMLPANFTVEQSLPFHFSDALRIITAIALITRASWAIIITYFWGLTLNLQAVLTPDLTYLQFPWVEYAFYWFLHAAALIVPIVFVWGVGYRPTWRGYAAGFGMTLAWAGVAVAANAITGANYAYLSRAPEGSSILDVLGPWPIYIIWEAVLIAGVWALMTWPWTTKRLGRSAPIADRFGFVRQKYLGPKDGPQLERQASPALDSKLEPHPSRSAKPHTAERVEPGAPDDRR